MKHRHKYVVPIILVGDWPIAGNYAICDCGAFKRIRRLM